MNNEVKSYSSVENGYYAAPRQNDTIGGVRVSTGGSMYTLTTMTSTANADDAATQGVRLK